MPEKNTENSINASALDRLISAHDGDMALLYLYFLRNGDDDMEDAAMQLCRTMSEISSADEKLRRMGIIPGSGDIRREDEALRVPAKPHKAMRKSVASVKDAPAEPENQIPEYTADEVVRRTKADGVFTGLLSECAKVIGHSLGTADMKMLFGIYDYLSLPPEVIMELLNYCAELCSEKYGSGHRPSMRNIEKQAYAWARQEILTLEQAEEYIKLQRERRGQLGIIASNLGIKDRHLSPGEAKYICSWLDMGFGEEAISVAYDRTVTGTGALKWPYMNKILQNWHSQNLHSAEEIGEKDGLRSKTPSPAAQQPAAQRSIDMDELRNALNKI